MDVVLVRDQIHEKESFTFHVARLTFRIFA